MELRARTPKLRRAAFLTALAALAVPATAGAAPTAAASASKVKAPVIKSVRPLDVAVGEWLEIRGSSFVRGRNRNTVVFKRDGARAVFAKAAYGTAKQIRVMVPASVQEFMASRAGAPSATRFRLRVLARKFGKRFTTLKRSPLISPPRPSKLVRPETLPSGDCDGDGRQNKLDSDDDGDALGDAVELSLGLDLCRADTDGDGVADRWEFDCDRDSVLNRDESDDDDDLLSDIHETTIGTDPCSSDSDGDTVEDGYEYQSAVDLNDDEHQFGNTPLPYPGKRPYPNALFADAEIDYDGDVLTLSEEYQLWKYTHSITRTDPRSLTLSYSDGSQYTRSRRIESGADAGRREPTLPSVGYDKHEEFVTWAGDAGYRTVKLDQYPWWAHASTRLPFGIFDMNRDGVEANAAGSGYRQSERFYYDLRSDGYLSDNERDEDADGLTNYDETHGRLTPQYWTGCYSQEKRFQVQYAGTSPVDGDSDGDGVRDGADDQDHDDIPNLMELSRNAASDDPATGGWQGLDDTNGMDCVPRTSPPLPSGLNHESAFGRVNPFNPCLPAIWSRSCPLHYSANTGAPFDLSPNWHALN